MNVPSSDDLINYILEHADNNTLVATAQLNRQWSEHSLNRIWKHLPSIFPLLQTLAPLTARQSSVYKVGFPGWTETNWGFSTDVPHDRWQRFALYDGRVHTLFHDDVTPFYQWSGSVQATTTSIILRNTTNRRQLLPILKRLTWRIRNFDSLPVISAALGPNVREVDVTVSSHSTLIPELFMELRERTTRLKMFRILVEPPSQQVPAILQSLLQHLLSESPHLSSISLPQFCLTRCLVDALGSLPDLRKLTYSDSGTSATPFVTEGCDFRFVSSSFPALVDVSFNMSLPNTQDVLKAAKREGSLTSITIGTRPWITGKRVLNEFLDVLVATNPGIESVNFNLFQDRVTVMEVLDGHDLLPLRKLKLKSFIIGHNRPFVVTSSDLQWMSEAWPNISTLVLNPDPVITQPESPPEGHDLTTLNCFAKSFPKLRRLGIYATIHHGFKSFTSENRFFYLDIIDLGTSALSQDCVDPVAAFLASLMPSISAVICSGPSIRHPLPSQDYYLSQWNTVRQLFPNYFRAQSDLRRRLETYQRIAEQLQLQLL